MADIPQAGGLMRGRKESVSALGREVAGPVPKRLPYRSFGRDCLSDERRHWPWRVGGSGCLEPSILLGPGGGMVWGEVCLA